MKFIHYSIDDAKKILNVAQVDSFFCHSESGFKFPFRISFNINGCSKVIYYGTTREERDAAWNLIGAFLVNDKPMLFLPEIVQMGGLVEAIREEARRTLEVVDG